MMWLFLKRVLLPRLLDLVLHLYSDWKYGYKWNPRRRWR